MSSARPAHPTGPTALGPAVAMWQGWRSAVVIVKPETVQCCRTRSPAVLDRWKRMFSRGGITISLPWSAQPDWKRLTPKGEPKGPHGLGAHPYPCAHVGVWIRLTTVRKEPGATTAVTCEGWRQQGQSSRITLGGVLCRPIGRINRHSRGSRGVSDPPLARRRRPIDPFRGVAHATMVCRRPVHSGRHCVGRSPSKGAHDSRRPCIARTARQIGTVVHVLRSNRNGVNDRNTEPSWRRTPGDSSSIDLIKLRALRLERREEIRHLLSLDPTELAEPE